MASDLPLLPPPPAPRKKGRKRLADQSDEAEERDRADGNQWFKDHAEVSKRDVADHLGVHPRDLCRFYRGELARGERGTQQALKIREGMKRVMANGEFVPEKKRRKRNSQSSSSEDEATVSPPNSPPAMPDPVARVMSMLGHGPMRITFQTDGTISVVRP